MRVWVVGLALLGASSVCAATAADGDVRSARTTINYLYEVDDVTLPVEPVVLAAEQADDLAAIGRSVAAFAGVPVEAVHLRAWSFAASFADEATLHSARLRLCLHRVRGEPEVVLDEQMPAGGATVLVPFRDGSLDLVMALRIERTDSERMVEAQEQLRADIDAHSEEDPMFPLLLAQRVQPCRER